MALEAKCSLYRIHPPSLILVFWGFDPVAYALACRDLNLEVRLKFHAHMTISATQRFEAVCIFELDARNTSDPEVSDGLHYQLSLSLSLSLALSHSLSLSLGHGSAGKRGALYWLVRSRTASD